MLFYYIMLFCYNILIIVQVFEEYLQICFKKYFHLNKRAIKCISNNHSICTHFINIYNSLKFDDIVTK